LELLTKALHFVHPRSERFFELRTKARYVFSQPTKSFGIYQFVVAQAKLILEFVNKANQD
jgi:hypothetical protein